jgi:hypothetical protein
MTVSAEEKKEHQILLLIFKFTIIKLNDFISYAIFHCNAAL